jgi:hypothetical protein
MRSASIPAPAGVCNNLFFAIGVSRGVICSMNDHRSKASSVMHKTQNPIMAEGFWIELWLKSAFFSNQKQSHTTH